MFSIGIIHLLTWFAATQNPYIVALIADEDIEHTMDTLVGNMNLLSEEGKAWFMFPYAVLPAFKNYQEIRFGLVGLIINGSAKPRLTILSQTNHRKAFGDEARLCDNLHSYKHAQTEGGSDFMDTSPTSPTCIARLSHAATPLPADDGMDGMDVDELPMPGTRDTDEAHEDTVDKLPASPTRAPDPPPADDGMHIDEPPVSGSGDVGKAHDTAAIAWGPAGDFLTSPTGSKTTE
ncbi:hypothetical protein BS47DRAFT_1397047 [Hydnum rufescens UP504]|uniref:Uncharacterized protein n=1 Tax=Hydnum rufescens UP504 TaxID=1448309 RepID=A0A9P6DS83_9AGAM|nr:hypothetical protein BS47DRAFT_1397047 [Hydnum rufescens UP504]